MMIKDEKSLRIRKGRKKWYTTLALVLTFVLAAAILVPAGQSFADDPPYSLTVNGGEYAADLAGAGLVFDIYRVATVSGGTWTYGSDFEKVKPASNDSKAYETFANECAGIILAEDADIQPVQTAAFSESAIGLDAGMYLMVPRNSNRTEKADYVTTATKDDGSAATATKAYSATYEYTFTPMLVSIVNDAATQLKATREERKGSLRIVKTLNDYEDREATNEGEVNDITFVFQVDAVLDRGDGNGPVNVFSTVVSKKFSAAEDNVEIAFIENKIPIGATVTVTEVYSGAGYTLTTDETVTGVISADTVMTAAFTNQYDHHLIQGGSVINSFDYSTERGAWDWENDLPKE